MADDQSTFVAVEQAGPVVTIRFNRPDKKNALTFAMYRAATAALQQAESDPTVRIIVLRGAGDSFTSGNDLQDFLTRSAGHDGSAPPATPDSPVMQYLKALSSASKIVVAGIQGAAVGIGTTMLLHCDLIVAAKSARLQLPFVNLALVPEAASSLLLPRLIGYHRAAELLLLGDAIDGATAHRIGLVNRLVEDSELDAAVAQIVAALAAKPPQALLATKRLMKTDGASTATRMAEESVVFAQQLQSPELKEAIQAFFEKRKPNFGG